VKWGKKPIVVKWSSFKKVNRFIAKNMVLTPGFGLIKKFWSKIIPTF
jgi:hypothetical protein